MGERKITEHTKASEKLRKDPLENSQHVFAKHIVDRNRTLDSDNDVFTYL